MQLIGLNHLRNSHLVIEDGPIRANKVEFWGCGWYSLDDDGIFRKGRAATYCRIRIAPWRFIDQVSANRIREARRNRAERRIRDLAIKYHAFTEDAAKVAKAARITERCRKLLQPRYNARAHSAFVASVHALRW